MLDVACRRNVMATGWSVQAGRICDRDSANRGASVVLRLPGGGVSRERCRVVL